MDQRQPMQYTFPQQAQSTFQQPIQQPVQQQAMPQPMPGTQTFGTSQSGFQHHQTFQQQPQQPINTYPQQPQQQPPPVRPAVVKKKVEIRSIGIWSMAKFQGLVTTIVGVVMAAVYMIIGTIIKGLMPSIAGGAEATEGAVAATIGTGIGTNLYSATLMSPSVTVFISIILGSAVIGFISGALLAIFYNILTVIVGGGIELELKAK